MADVNEEVNPAVTWWEDVKRTSHNIFEQLDKFVHELIGLGVPLGSSKDAEPETDTETTDTQDGVNQ